MKKTKKFSFKMLIRIVFLSLAACAAVILLFRAGTLLYARPRMHTAADVSPSRAAIVFGAGLRRDGSPTPVLQDRVQTAVELYFAGKVEKILMSGDNRFLDYNEPGAMFNYARELGVPSDDIVLDFAGRRTYDTCYRAKAIFGLQEAVLVTQRFHLPRAILLCSQLGIQAQGVASDQRTYRRSSRAIWSARETIATFTAFIDLWVRKPVPVLGDPEPIFPDS